MCFFARDERVAFVSWGRGDDEMASRGKCVDVARVGGLSECRACDGVCGLDRCVLGVTDTQFVLGVAVLCR